MTDADLDKPINGSSFTRGRVLTMRLMDTWIHDKDIRRALDQPADFDGYAADLLWTGISLDLPRVVARKAATPDGTVVFLVEKRSPVSILVEGGRGVQLPDVPATPAVVISMDFESFLCVGLGRWTAERVIARGRVGVEGDDQAGRKILDSMNVMLDQEATVPAYGEEVAWVD